MLRVGVLVGCLLVAGCGDDGEFSAESSGGSGGGASGGDAGRAIGGGAGTSSGGAGGGDAGQGAGGTAGASGGAGAGGEGGAGTAARPHPLYPTLDLDTLPGDGGGAVGPYEPPTLPTTSRSITVDTTGTEARDDLLDACQTSGTAVEVPNGAGHLGSLDFGNVTDCDVTLGHEVVADFVYVGHLPGPQIAPTHRIRIRGGRIGHIMVDPGSTDIVFDGVTVDSGIAPPDQRAGVAVYLIGDPADYVDRFAVVNSVLRMLPTAPDAEGNQDGCGYLAGSARNVFFANDNFVTSGNRNSWGFRIGGGDNFLIVDSTVRVSFHKLIRMNDGPVDYVYVKGGTWLREATTTAGGDELNDSFAQLGDLGTDNVFIHDPSVYLLSGEPVSFGASSGPGQAGKSWEARRIAWHAVSDAVVSDARLGEAEGYCVPEATCDYGVGSHTYDIDPALAFPSNPWRSLPALPEDDPDALAPIAAP